MLSSRSSRRGGVGRMVEPEELDDNPNRLRAKARSRALNDLAHESPERYEQLLNKHRKLLGLGPRVRVTTHRRQRNGKKG